MKKLFPALAFALLAPAAFSQEEFGLDIIYRDFYASYYGFDMWDQNASPRKCAEKLVGKNAGKSNMATPENGICFTGDVYHSCDKGGVALSYDAVNCEAGAKRGYKNGPDGSDPILGIAGSQGCWNDNVGQPVYVTRGMVAKRLDYSQCKGDEAKGTGVEQAINGRYCARPMPGNGLCYGENLQEWFTDGGVAKRIDDVLMLKRVGTTGQTYRIDYNYNTKEDWNNWPAGTVSPPNPSWGTDGGFFPLDKYSNDLNMTYGRQNINEWCGDAGNCNYTFDPAQLYQYANSNNKLKQLHNYGFSMAGSGEFKYKKGNNDVFKFIGDDDMWIFIDGDLFEDPENGTHADLGGNHLAAPAVINIERLAAQKGWADDSKHAINFFYMERQVDGSNLTLLMSLTDLKPPKFGAPRITEAKTIIDDEGNGTTTIYVSNKLNLNTIKANDPANPFPILVYKGNPNDAVKGEIYGYKLESIKYGAEVPGKGYTYIITGYVCSTPACNEDPHLNLSSGDWLSFSIPKEEIADAGFKNAGSFGLDKDCNACVTAENSTMKSSKAAWGLNKTDIPEIEFVVITPDPNPGKPEFPIEPGNGSSNAGQEDPTVAGGIVGGSVCGGSCSAGAGMGNIGDLAGSSGGKIWPANQVWNPKTGQMEPFSNASGTGDNTAGVHGFGPVGTKIPPQRAGELILTVYPGTASQGYNRDKYVSDPKFGLPPTAVDGGWWGAADPSKTSGADGLTGSQFVKNGFPNESNTKGKVQISPTRCTTNLDKPDEPRINCLNVTFDVKQPFQLAVTIYDQVGNFVTQYRETITPQEFRNITQAAAYYSEGTMNPAPNTCEVLDPTKTSGPGSYGHPNTLAANTMVRVSANIYPFSANGRRFGNGVFLVKVDRVDLPMPEGLCISPSGGQTDVSYPIFIRQHQDEKAGWMRTK